MVTRPEIQSYVDAVVERFRPQRVVLFGSHAYGDPTEDSDVDLLVVMPHRGRTMHEAAVAIRTGVERGFAMDLLVRSNAEIAERIRMGDCFMEEITSKGLTLYERADRRMDREGGKRLRRRRSAPQVATTADA